MEFFGISMFVFFQKTNTEASNNYCSYYDRSREMGKALGWEEKRDKILTGRFFFNLCWTRLLSVSFSLLMKIQSKSFQKYQTFFFWRFAKSNVRNFEQVRSECSCIQVVFSFAQLRHWIHFFFVLVSGSMTKLSIILDSGPFICFIFNI